MSSARFTDQAMRLEGIKKSFGHVRALAGVDLDIWFGRATALVGDNGAGKSTLLKIAAGVEQPDDGYIRVRGTTVDLRSPQEARSLGIEAVHQDLALVPNLTVSENMFLGRELRYGGGLLGRLGFLRRREMREESEQALGRLGIELPRGAARKKVAVLSGGQRQAVSISRAVHMGHDILLLDEPTAALGLIETQKTLDMVNRLKEQGLAILVISHNFGDVAAVADQVVILRRGEQIASLEGDEVRQDRIVGILKEMPDEHRDVKEGEP